MKIAYVRPYDGEIDIVSSGLEPHEIISTDDVHDLADEVLSSIDILSVFVDYKVTSDVLDKFPNLKLIATRSAGYDHIDLKTAEDRGIALCRVPHYGTRTVAEYAIALIFALSRNAFRSYTDMKRDVSEVNFEAYEGFDLYGKTLGVIGTGAIGRSVCEIAKGIGMKVLAYDVFPNESFAKNSGVSYVSLDEILAQSDIITLHVPSMPETKHLINEDALRSMKAGSYLINTARGEVVDTKALVESLNSKHLAGAALDVLEGEHSLREEAELLSDKTLDSNMWETLVADHALVDMPNVIVTPHIAFNTVEAKREITDITVDNIKSFIAGEPKNTISL